MRSTLELGLERCCDGTVSVHGAEAFSSCYFNHAGRARCKKKNHSYACCCLHKCKHQTDQTELAGVIEYNTVALFHSGICIWIDQLVIKETNNQYMERLYIIAQYALSTSSWVQ